MSQDHRVVPTAPTRASMTVRLGAAATTAENYSTADEGKAVKLAGESRFVFAVAGDEIEGFITSVEAATQNGWSIGGVNLGDPQWVTADGVQADGTGAIAVGDYVLAGAITAKGTRLTQYQKVRKATTQANVKASPFSWRVVSLGPVGTGAVGTAIVIARASA